MVLGGLFQFDDRKMSATTVVRYRECQPNARQNLVATRGPFRAWLEASSLVGWGTALVNLKRRRSTKRLMRAMFVEPGCVRRQIMPHCFEA